MLCAHCSLTTKGEYHYKGCERYKQLIHNSIYAVQHSPSYPSYTLVSIINHSAASYTIFILALYIATVSLVYRPSQGLLHQTELLYGVDACTLILDFFASRSIRKLWIELLYNTLSVTITS